MAFSIARARMQAQHLLPGGELDPSEVVRHLGGVQSQDFPGAKWALAIRTGANDAAIENALREGRILRTHVMRPTWHFVTREDIRWMLRLTGLRVNSAMASQLRLHHLDEAVCARSNDALRDALRGGVQLTRAGMTQVLRDAGIERESTGYLHLFARAEIELVICSGAHQGKQPTYALLDDRAPKDMPLPREEALAELARRYFKSHGPATVRDYIWWSGLAAADARAGLQAVASELAQVEVGSATYWQDPELAPSDVPKRSALLLPNYDEYVVGYADRSAITPHPLPDTGNRGSPVFQHTIVVDGLIVGGWTRRVLKDRLEIAVRPAVRLTAAEAKLVERAAEAQGAFLGLPVVTTVGT